MADLEIRLTTTGLDEMLRLADPKQVYTIINLWFLRGSEYVKGELRARAPGRLKSKVYVRMDLMRPPRWARISVKSPLAHLIEGGTGRLGDPAFNHSPDFFPSWNDIARETGLPKAQAFLIARTISEQGGTRPRPFFKPTHEATKGRLLQMGEEIAREVMR